MKKLIIVVPCYKEEAVLPETTKRLTELLDRLIDQNKIDMDSCILYVNDGSKDNTWPIIQELHHYNKYVNGVNLAGNVGHQNAVMAGLTVAADKGDIIVTIDADLQDDINAIESMVSKFDEGCDIVYGVRSSRATDTWFKRTSALAFYKLMKVMGIKSVYNHADYRLMSKRSLQFLLQFHERNLFIRGIVPLLGYKTDCVYYNRAARFAGESKYPLSKMIGLAFEGITSFSTKPIHLVLYIGLLFIMITFMILLYVGGSYCFGIAMPGWTSLILSIWFCSGCLMIAMGIIGEYIGKIYLEVKNRPRYNIEEVLFK